VRSTVSKVNKAYAAAFITGLALATVVDRVCQIGIPMNYHHPVDWLTLWALYEGAFAIGCLIC